jgi:hypothetical protein
MPRNRTSDLRDVHDVLARIRALPGVTERAPGVFWLHRTPFMHFHTARPPRRVHVKNGRDWGAEIILPVGATRSQRAAFVREVRARWAACEARRSVSSRRR